MKSVRTALRQYEKNIAAANREQKHERLLEAIRESQQKPVRFIEALLNKKIKYTDFPEGTLGRNIPEVLQSPWYYTQGTRQGFAKFLKNLATKVGSTIVNQPKQDVRFLLNIYFHRNDWVRPLEHWTDPQDASRMQTSLVQYLLVRYEMPAFMYKAWTMQEAIFHDWFVRMGRGENIRKAPTMPASLSKKMAHFFLQAPAQYSPIAAVRYGQILGMGGSETLAAAVIATPLGRGFGEETFWETFLRWLVNHEQDLQMAQVNPIVDYVMHKRFRGDLGKANAACNAQFVMKGRTWQALSRLVNEWHRTHWAGQTTAENDKTYWKGFLIRDFICEVGNEKDEKEIYFFQQLTTANALQKESNQMRHCVASYTYKCLRGEASIWTVWLEKDLQQQKILTIELSKHHEIVQARGHHNRLPTQKELKVLKLWAKARNLRIPTWLPVTAG